MKLFPSVAASSVLAVIMLGGCAMNPHQRSVATPGIKVFTESHNLSANTTTRVSAETMNVVGAGDIRWSVSPNVARLQADGPHGTSVLFSSDQPGTYIVKASVDTGDGRWTSDQVDIAVHGVEVNGRPINNSDRPMDSNNRPLDANGHPVPVDANGRPR